jgi:hypothetical protein
VLGHFMERSTSAPPVSTEHHKFSGDNLMNDSDVSDFVFLVSARAHQRFQVHGDNQETNLTHCTRIFTLVLVWQQ